MNKTLHKEEIQYINYTGENKFAVKLKTISIDSYEIFLNPKLYETIIDSGTTMTYLPSSIYKDLEKAVSNFCSAPNRCMGAVKNSNVGFCYKLNENINLVQFIESMPTFKFLFNDGVNYYLKPENYIFNYSDFNSKSEGNVYCTGITSWDKNEILLGTTWMHNHDIIFDMQHNKIGFAATECTGGQISVIREKIKIETSDSRLYRIIIYSVIAALCLVVIFLIMAIRKIRRGEQFLWMTVNNTEDAVNKHDVSVIIERNVFNN